MESLFSILTYYIQGKPVWGPLRKTLDLLLSFNITFLVWDRFYGPIHWDQYDEFGEIMNFLFRGGFLIPVCILILSQFAIILTGLIFYSLSHWFRAYLINRLVGRLRLVSRSEDQESSKVIDAFNQWSKVRGERRLMINFFSSIRKADLEQIHKKSQDAQVLVKELKETFNVFWKLLIASFLFEKAVPEFYGVLSYLTVFFATLAMGACVTFIALQQQIPVLTRKFATEAEEYLVEKEKEALEMRANE